MNWELKLNVFYTGRFKINLATCIIILSLHINNIIVASHSYVVTFSQTCMDIKFNIMDDYLYLDSLEIKETNN